MLTMGKLQCILPSGLIQSTICTGLFKTVVGYSLKPVISSMQSLQSIQLSPEIHKTMVFWSSAIAEIHHPCEVYGNGRCRCSG